MVIYKMLNCLARKERIILMSPKIITNVHGLIFKKSTLNGSPDGGCIDHILEICAGKSDGHFRKLVHVHRVVMLYLALKHSYLLHQNLNLWNFNEFTHFYPLLFRIETLLKNANYITDKKFKPCRVEGHLHKNFPLNYIWTILWLTR